MSSTAARVPGTGTAGEGSPRSSVDTSPLGVAEPADSPLNAPVAGTPGPAPRVEVFDPGSMNAVGARPPLGSYLRELWGSRHFIVYDARVRLAVSQDHTFLGRAWIVLNPVLLGLTFYVIFGLLLHTGRGIDNFVAFIVLGLTMFMYSTRSIVSVSRSMASGKALVRGFMFPRAALTLSIVMRDALTQVYALGAILVFLLVVPPLEPISWTWLLLIPVFVLQTVFNWGFGMLLAPAVHKIPDLANMLSFFMRLWMYSSGIFYDPSRFVSDERVLSLFHANTLYQVLSMSRDLVLRAQVPSWSSWGVLAGTAAVMVVAGFLVFWWNEESYADER